MADSSLPEYNDVMVEADDESVCLREALDKRLDDLFALGDEDAECAEPREKNGLRPVDSNEAARSQKSVRLDKGKAGKAKTEAANTLTAQQKKRAVFPAAGIKSPAAADSNNKAVQIPKGTTHSNINSNGAAKKKKTAVKKTILVAQREKPEAPGKIVDQRVDRRPSPIISQSEIKGKFVVSKKEEKKPVSKQNKSKQILRKLILGGIILAGGVLAVFIYFKTPEPSGQIQPRAAKATYKISKPPAQALEKHPAPPVAPPHPQRAAAKVSLTESAVADKAHKPLTSMAAASTDPKTLVPVTTPAMDAATEIKAWLSEWAAAWEKCAGENGDMSAFLSFYSDDFSYNVFDKSRWGKDKLEKNRGKAWIRIKLDDINIAGPFGDGHYEARFNQVYQSSNYSDTSTQALILKKESAGWKIVGIKS